MKPFVLIDDARPGGTALLFEEPEEIVATRDPGEVRACLDRLRRPEGRHAAGFLSYEAGHNLDAKLAPLRAPSPAAEPPLLWFGLFGSPRPVDAAAILPDPAGAWAGPVRPLVGRGDYLASAERVLEHIRAGDIYQANLTFPAEIRTAGHPQALYAALRRRARGGHCALVFTGEHWILSFSPELFFTLEGGRLTARPMKGTAPAGADPEKLRNDPKQQAENLMIVDLLRNDLSRVSVPGSVEVPALFEVEHYPTVLQMTSTVTAAIEPGLGPVDVIEAIFPCGSITGAPKLRAIEVAAALEMRARGVYTGAIGRVAPDGAAGFSVAIRTLTMRAGESVAQIGLGSGIVADSRAADEWRECLAKGAFVHDPERSFDLVETMRFCPHEGIVRLERHLERLKASAEALGFAFDRHGARNELQAATFRAGASKVRLVLSPAGTVAVELRPIGMAPPEPIAVAVAPLPVDAGDFRLAHKTSDRAFYDEARAAADTAEVLFADPAGYLTEGSYTNLFVERGGRLLTPPLARGLLPGVLRAELLADGRAEEADLVEADLVGGFFVGNSLRGLMRARLAQPMASSSKA